VTLQVKGKYRSVTWRCLTKGIADTRQAQSAEKTATYQVVSSWSDWTPQDMTYDAVSNTYSLKTKVLQPAAYFYIIRNKDWGQALGPYAQSEARIDAPIIGPGMHTGGCWATDTQPGSVLKIDFSYDQSDAKSQPKIEWTILRREKLTEADVVLANRLPFFILSSSPGFEPIKMAYTSQYYQAFVELGSTVAFEFVVSQGFAGRKLFPSVPNASPFEPHEIMDVDWTGDMWKIGGDGDDPSPSKRYELKVFVADGRVSRVTWSPVGDSVSGLEDAMGKGILILGE